MSAVTRLGVGSRLLLDGEPMQVVELLDRDVLVRGASGDVRRVPLVTILDGRSDGIRLLDGAEDDRQLGDPVADVLGQLPDEQLQLVRERAGHIREVLTGFRSGSAELACDGEPREGYGPGTTLNARYALKAEELGVSAASVRRWATAFRADGEAGLVDGRGRISAGPAGNVDPRWLEVCRTVLSEQVESSTKTKSLILRTIAARLEQQFGPGVVPVPGKSRAYEVLTELSNGRSMWSNSKARRSIANRPVTSYGRLEATRPGEYLLLDTTRLDVFAMDAVTLRWVQAELTVSLDLYTRCVVGLRLTPVSTKSIDAASVVYQALRPAALPDATREIAGQWPHHGVPASVVVPVDKLATDSPLADAGVLPIAPETLVVDHGKIFISEHLTSACARLGISIQPARPYTPTDKAPVERFFRTLREGLLQALPGYKGPDVFNRGKDVEGEAFFFLHELEDIIREWVALVYHRRLHDGLVDPHVPGLRLSPAAMFAHGVARSGYIQIPSRSDLAFEFLPVSWTSIQHYGVNVGTLRYNGDGLTDFRNKRSPYLGRHAGKWPIRYNPDDASVVWFRNPDTGSWHRLDWEHARRLTQPFSFEALGYAKRLAAAQDRFPDTIGALEELLGRWNIGLGISPAERRMALRLASQRTALELPAPAVTTLPSVRAALAGSEQADDGAVELLQPHLVVDVGDQGPPTPPPPVHLSTPDADDAEVPGGDDDEDEDDLVDLDGDFYADAVEPLL
ncbi:MAG TPA: integrase [Amycolatopsis sp.]|nr:integrase [Amycolatopsis sp.]